MVRSALGARSLALFSAAVNTERHGDNTCSYMTVSGRFTEAERGGCSDLQQQTHSLWAASMFNTTVNIQCRFPAKSLINKL